jgi:hypothetical protein
MTEQLNFKTFDFLNTGLFESFYPGTKARQAQYG